MSISTTYLLNVALHAAILSIFASLVLLALRQARHRSVAAIAGLLAIGFLPWLTALRPTRSVTAPAQEIQTHEAPALPTWTVVTLPAQQEATPLPETPAAASAKFVFPDPLATVITIWAAGAGFGFLVLAIASLKVRLWRKSLLPLDDAAWKTLQSLSPEIPARRHFLLSETTASPCVTGLFRPRIVLPKFLLESGSEEGLRWALRHEFAHWQAGDSRWMILFTLIRCTNWWNPLAHRLVSQWADAREQLCDLHATGVSETRADYGEFLIAMARRITSQPPLTVAMAKRPHARKLKSRIVSLLGATVNSEKPVGKRFIAVSSAVFVACAATTSSVRIRAEEPAIEFKAISESAILEEQHAPKPSEGIPTVSQPPDDTRPPQTQSPAAPPPVSRQLSTKHKFIVTDFKPGFAESVSKDGSFSLASLFSDQQEQLIMRNLAQKKGTYLMTAPGVTSLSGQTATIEIIRKIPGTLEQIAKRGPESETPFVGISLPLTCRFVDDQPARPPATEMIELEETVDYRFIPGVYQPANDANAEPVLKANPETIKSVKRSIKGRLPSGYTVCTDLGEIEPGKFLTVLTQVKVDHIDADPFELPIDRWAEKWIGPEDIWNRQELNPDEVITEDRRRQILEDLKIRRENGTLPVDATLGKLRLRGTLVDLPLKTPRNRGEGLVIGLTPSTREAAERILATSGAKARKLKPVEIPLNERATPWPEVPQLNVSGVASRDFKLITVASHAVGNGEGEFPNRWNDLTNGCTMNFGIKTANTAIERRLLITVEAVK